jgi:hypothetical protein
MTSRRIADPSKHSGGRSFGEVFDKQTSAHAVFVHLEVCVGFPMWTAASRSNLMEYRCPADWNCFWFQKHRLIGDSSDLPLNSPHHWSAIGHKAQRDSKTILYFFRPPGERQYRTPDDLVIGEWSHIPNEPDCVRNVIPKRSQTLEAVLRP